MVCQERSVCKGAHTSPETGLGRGWDGTIKSGEGVEGEKESREPPSRILVCTVEVGQGRGGSH